MVKQEFVITQEIKVDDILKRVDVSKKLDSFNITRNQRNFILKYSPIDAYKSRSYHEVIFLNRENDSLFVKIFKSSKRRDAFTKANDEVGIRDLFETVPYLFKYTPKSSICDITIVDGSPITICKGEEGEIKNSKFWRYWIQGYVNVVRFGIQTKGDIDVNQAFSENYESIFENLNKKDLDKRIFNFEKEFNLGKRIISGNSLVLDNEKRLNQTITKFLDLERVSYGSIVNFFPLICCDHRLNYKKIEEIANLFSNIMFQDLGIYVDYKKLSRDISLAIPNKILNEISGKIDRDDLFNHEINYLLSESWLK
jgi:hypothetical protein